MPRKKPSIEPHVAELLEAYGGNMRTLVDDLTTHLAARGAIVPSITPTFTPRPRPAEPVTFRVRIDIDGAKPPIWRRLDLAGDLTLAQVHLAIQAAFIWQDMHLHAFTPELPGVRDRMAPSFDNAELDDPHALAPEKEVRLDEVISQRGDRLFYVYDFGDSWRHTVKVEDVKPRRDGPRAACLGGRRATPMEDSGGIRRYNEIVAALAGKDAMIDEKTLAEARQWLGGDFDPDDPDLDDLEDLDAVVSGRRVAPFLSYPHVDFTAEDDKAELRPPDPQGG